MKSYLTRFTLLDLKEMLNFLERNQASITYTEKTHQLKHKIIEKINKIEEKKEICEKNC